MATSENFEFLSGYSETVTENLNRPFTVSGRRGYLVGHMDGSFPDLGHHIPGEMGGLWTPPVKLADGWWFGLREAGSKGDWQWLYGKACQKFTMSPGRASREFSVKLGETEVKATQEFFITDDEPAHFISLTLTNPSGQMLNLEVAWLVRFDIRGAWWSEWPDRPDKAHFDQTRGTIVARDSLTTSWGAFMQGDATPQNGVAGPDLWGPEKTGSLKGSDNRKEGIYRQQAELQGEGISGRLTYAVELPPNSPQTLNFVIAGNDHFDEGQLEWAENLLAKRQEYLDRKLAAQAELVSHMPRLEAPKPEYGRIFDGSALCLDMLTADIPGLGHGIMAGLQGFAWYFGCDTYYTLSGLLMSGQAKTGLDTLKILASYGRNQRGRIPHEIVFPAQWDPKLGIHVT